GSSTGTLIGTLDVPNTGGFQVWETEEISVNPTTGIHDVYFVFKGSSSNIFNINHWTFSENGLTGVANNASQNVKVFPNPFNDGGFNILCDGTFEYLITDLSGSLLEAGKGENN